MQVEKTGHFQISAGGSGPPARVHSPPFPLSPAKRRGKEGEEKSEVRSQKSEGKDKKMSEPRMGGMKRKHIQHW